MIEASLVLVGYNLKIRNYIVSGIILFDQKAAIHLLWQSVQFSNAAEVSCTWYQIFGCNQNQCIPSVCAWTPKELPWQDDIYEFSVHRTLIRILRAVLGFSSPGTLLGIHDVHVSEGEEELVWYIRKISIQVSLIA